MSEIDRFIVYSDEDFASEHSTSVKTNDGKVYNVKLFYLHPKRFVGASKILYLLYTSILELFIVSGMIVMNFFALVPTYDYYFSVFLHICHLFSWALIYCSINKVYNVSYIRATLIVIGFNFILDIGGFIWRILDDLLCTQTAGSMCADNFYWGMVGWILSLILVFFDIMDFVLLETYQGAVIGKIKNDIKKNMELMNKLKASKNQKRESGNQELVDQFCDSTEQFCDDKILQLYFTLNSSPLSYDTFGKRSILFAAGLAEVVFFYLTLVLMMLGLTVTPDFMWSIFLQSLHFFSWAFLFACIHNCYSKSIFIGTMCLYLVCSVTDLAAAIWRLVEILTCDVVTNVDCVFRQFPDLLPILLFNCFLIVCDAVTITTLSQLYKWILENMWGPAVYVEQSMFLLQQSMKNKIKSNSRNANTQTNVLDPNQILRNIETVQEAEVSSSASSLRRRTKTKTINKLTTMEQGRTKRDRSYHNASINSKSYTRLSDENEDTYSSSPEDDNLFTDTYPGNDMDSFTNESQNADTFEEDDTFKND